MGPPTPYLHPPTKPGRRGGPHLTVGVCASAGNESSICAQNHLCEASPRAAKRRVTAGPCGLLIARGPEQSSSLPSRGTGEPVPPLMGRGMARRGPLRQVG
eukprot:scaffold50_cov420-Prasinococcus_capsulatus_cf.AAC.41